MQPDPADKFTIVELPFSKPEAENFMALLRESQERKAALVQLQAELNNLRRASLEEIAALRRDLSDSENMRAQISQELQRVRGLFDECRKLATGSLEDDEYALSGLADDGLLNITGLNLLDEVRDWLSKFGVK